MTAEEIRTCSDALLAPGRCCTADCTRTAVIAVLTEDLVEHAHCRRHGAEGPSLARKPLVWDKFWGAGVNPIVRYAEITGSEDFEFDELIAYNATVHMEAMSKTTWWIGIDLPDGRSFAVNLGARNQRAGFFATVEED